TGSRPRPLPDVDFGDRVWDSERALGLSEVPDRLLVVGGGYVGLEMGSVYSALGSEVTIVEEEERLLPEADADLARVLSKRVAEEVGEILAGTRVDAIGVQGDEVRVTLGGETNDGTDERPADRVLVAIGREPRSDDLGLENTDVEPDDRGFIRVDAERRTDDESIFAVGDVTGGKLLAHEAIREGKVAAEVLAGEASAFDNRAVPAVVYTDPQVAWCGLTERDAEEEGVEVEVRRFPWKASGRALTLDGEEGLTKILFHPSTGRVLGVGIVGRDAEALIAEAALAVEMGAVARDLAETVHPHPTLSETLGEAADLLLGGSIHLASG
ncbi:MAG: NAD(P)/FAD-dependent oxidoreductase, partial [Longimicrobiales bacterium]|nr:NAD(P)/FAD-dependent oxidoreductase [Longimicrobiales bacterium]